MKKETEKNTLPDDLVHLKKYNKYPTILENILVDENPVDNFCENNIYDVFDMKKINTENNIINKETLNKMIIKDIFFSNYENVLELQKQNTPKLICYHNEYNLFSSFSSSIPLYLYESEISIKKKKKKKKKNNKKNKKRKTNVIHKEIEEEYNRLLDLNNKIKKFINKNYNLNEIDKMLLKEFIDRITNNFNFDQNTGIYELKKLSEDLYIKLNNYLNLQIEKNNRTELLYIKSVFNLYMQIFDEKFKEDYETDPVHFF